MYVCMYVCIDIYIYTQYTYIQYTYILFIYIYTYIYIYEGLLYFLSPSLRPGEELELIVAVFNYAGVGRLDATLEVGWEESGTR